MNNAKAILEDRLWKAIAAFTKATSLHIPVVLTARNSLSPKGVTLSIRKLPHPHPCQRLEFASIPDAIHYLHTSLQPASEPTPNS